MGMKLMVVDEECFRTIEDKDVKLDEISLESLKDSRDFTRKFYFHTNVSVPRKIVAKVTSPSVHEISLKFHPDQLRDHQ